jgi:hypothetical protein
MLKLSLRPEFLGKQAAGTAISLRRSDHNGAAEQPPMKILEITYPTADVQTALRALNHDRSPRPVVLLGDRGRGKSHIMAIMHHAVANPDVVEAWAQSWGQRLKSPVLESLKLQRGYFPISEAVHNQEFKYLWDLLFARHPKGQLYLGHFQASGKPYPSRSLLEEMFKSQPTVLILDEFQKWYDGLHDETGPSGVRWREVASNFIQNLSEMSRERPEWLMLIVSCLNNGSDAFRQIHRDTPVVINFMGPTAKKDRQNLLLHRLFLNRANIPQAEVQALVDTYAHERRRLRFPHLPASEHARLLDEVVASWPFTPELLELLEDHILMSQAAQETRDLIRILATNFRARGDAVPLLTPADFSVDDDTCGLQPLLTSIAVTGSQESLLEIAQRNLEGLQKQGVSTPHSREIISSLWMRSMSPTRVVGGTKQDLQLDVTRGTAIPDSAFTDELLRIRDNSINIHGSDDAQGRLWFGLDENPKTKVRSTARQDRLWTADPSASTPGSYPGKDKEHIRATLRHLLVPDTRQSISRVIVLGADWQANPWTSVEVADRPENWTQPVLLVIPSALEDPPGSAQKILGKWLAQHVGSKRNTVRFLIQASNTKNLYEDPDLRFAARCSYLVTQAWKDDAAFGKLGPDFDRPFRDMLRARFDRFAVLVKWNFKEPEKCQFSVEKVDGQLVVSKNSLPLAIDAQVLKDHVDANAFQTLVIEAAKTNTEVSKLVDGLKEPPPDGSDAIPYLGETLTCEQILGVASRGKIVLNVGGTWVGRLAEHTTDEDALTYIRQRAFRSAQEMRQVLIALPGAAGSSAVTSPQTVPSTVPPGTLPFGGGTTAAAATPMAGSSGPTGFPPVTPPIEAGNGSVTTALTDLVPVPAVTQTRVTPMPTNGVTLMGSFDQWGISSDTTLDTARIAFAGLTVQQVKQILQKLPSNVKATLDVSWKKEGPA